MLLAKSDCQMDLMDPMPDKVFVRYGYGTRRSLYNTSTNFIIFL